jgi:hypothetical protein
MLSERDDILNRNQVSSSSVCGLALPGPGAAFRHELTQSGFYVDPLAR